MNLDYLQNELLPLREVEIIEGQNACTRNPIYVVLDLRECYVSGHSDISPITNCKGINIEYGYVDDNEQDDAEFKITDEEMVSPREVSRFFVDEVVAFFLTSKGAHDYMGYQSHNLRNPYVYVFSTGYRNYEMDKLFDNT